MTLTHEEFSRRGGVIGGHARARKLSKKRLREIALMGVRARLRKAREKKRQQKVDLSAQVIETVVNEAPGTIPARGRVTGQHQSQRHL